MGRRRWLGGKMAAVSLRLGDLVWGKLGRYPPWPGKIVNPPKDLKKPRGKKCFFVKFFGTEDHAWIKVEQLKPYHAHKEEMIKINKGKRFQQAVDAVEEFLRRAKGKDQTSSHTSADDKNRRNSSEERSRPNSGDAVNHPTPMAAAANEVYKRAKALDQSDNDMSAVYRAYIH